VDRDDWIALGLIAVLAYGMRVESSGAARATPARRIAPATAPLPDCHRAMPGARLWRAAAVALLLAAFPLAAALACDRAALRRAGRQRARRA